MKASALFPGLEVNNPLLSRKDLTILVGLVNQLISMVYGVGNVMELYQRALDGEREPFNYICITPMSNEAAKDNEDVTDAWIKSAMAWIKKVQEIHNEKGN